MSLPLGLLRTSFSKVMARLPLCVNQVYKVLICYPNYILKEMSLVPLCSLATCFPFKEALSCCTTEQSLGGGQDGW